MLNARFETGKQQNSHYVRNLCISVGIFAIVFGLCLMGFSKIGNTTVREEYNTLEKALNSGIMHCYAIEGRYPESLEYLQDNYGLMYNSSRFFVDYQPLGANIMPDVTIIIKEKQNGK